MAAPMPFDAPVTTATFPASLAINALLGCRTDVATISYPMRGNGRGYEETGEGGRRDGRARPLWRTPAGGGRCAGSKSAQAESLCYLEGAGAQYIVSRLGACGGETCPRILLPEK